MARSATQINRTRSLTIAIMYTSPVHNTVILTTRSRVSIFLQKCFHTVFQSFLQWMLSYCQRNLTFFFTHVKKLWMRCTVFCSVFTGNSLIPYKALTQPYSKPPCTRRLFFPMSPSVCHYSQCAVDLSSNNADNSYNQLFLCGLFVTPDNMNIHIRSIKVLQ